MCYLFVGIFHMYYSQTEKQNSITKRKTKLLTYRKVKFTHNSSIQNMECTDREIFVECCKNSKCILTRQIEKK